jgi:C-terminal processing protease CtpA/Prc
VAEGSDAAKAGIKEGDIVYSVDDADLHRDPQALISRIGDRVGKSVKLAIKRGETDSMVNVQVGSRTDTSYKISELSNPTPEQLKIREAWLKARK